MPASFYRYLYAEVGRAYRWVDRLAWTDGEIRAHLASPGVSLWLSTVRAAPAGYFELKADAEGAVEIAYFGLLPEFIGRGYGKHLLTEAVERAWSAGRPPGLAAHLLAGRSRRPPELSRARFPALPRRDLFRHRPRARLPSASNPAVSMHLHVVVPSTTMGCCVGHGHPQPVVLSS